MTECYLITGGAGFIGSHLAERLLSQGNGTVVVVDNFDPFYAKDNKERNIQDLRRNKNCKVVEVDIRDDAQVRDLFAKTCPTVVFHLAAKAGARHSIENPVAYTDVNVRGTVVLLENSAHTGVRDFLFASSSSVYGNAQTIPFGENMPVHRSISPYAATKRAGELLCETYHHLNGLNIAMLRLFTVYGPRQRPDLAIHKFTEAILKNQPCTLYGNGSTLRDYTYVDDIVDGLIACQGWLRGQTHSQCEVFNLGNSQPVSLMELVSLLESVLGKKAQVRHMEPQQGDVERTSADISRARQAFGYTPKIDTQEGLRRFVTWLSAPDASVTRDSLQAEEMAFDVSG